MEPTTEVWDHGILHFAGVRISEGSLLQLVELPHCLPTDLSISLEQWCPLAETVLGLTAAQATACMQLVHLLAPPRGSPQPPLVVGENTRVPLGSLLLLLWVQTAHQQLGPSSAITQAATGDVWPSFPPHGGAAEAPLSSPRRIAVASHLSDSQQGELAHARRKLVRASLPTILRLVGAGSERLYAAEFDRLGLILRPERAAAERLGARGLPAASISSALGVWDAQPAAALPLSALLPVLSSALVALPAPAKPACYEPLSFPALHVASCSPSHAPSTPSPPALAPGRHPPPRSPLSAELSPRPALSVADSPTESPRHGALTRATAAGAEGEVLRLAGTKRRTVVLRPAQLRGGALQLVDCHNCYVYALAPLRAAELLGCTGCVVVLGAVGRVLSLHHCERLQLHAAAAFVRCGNCIDTTLHLCVNSRPLLWGENHRLVLAPFGTIYRDFAGAHAASRTRQPSPPPRHHLGVMGPTPGVAAARSASARGAPAQAARAQPVGPASTQRSAAGARHRRGRRLSVGAFRAVVHPAAAVELPTLPRARRLASRRRVRGRDRRGGRTARGVRRRARRPRRTAARIRRRA